MKGALGDLRSQRLYWLNLFLSLMYQAEGRSALGMRKLEPCYDTDGYGVACGKVHGQLNPCAGFCWY